MTKTTSAECMRVHRKRKKLGKTPCQVEVFDGMCTKRRIINQDNRKKHLQTNRRLIGEMVRATITGR